MRYSKRIATILTAESIDDLEPYGRRLQDHIRYAFFLPDLDESTLRYADELGVTRAEISELSRYSGLMVSRSEKRFIDIPVPIHGAENLAQIVSR